MKNERMGLRKGKVVISVFLLVLMCTAMLSLTASAAGTVAKIGTKKYASLQAAFNAVKNGQTIKLQKNMKIAFGKSVTMKRNIKFTLDLNGKTIKTDEGSVSGEKVGINLKKGTMTVKNGTITGGWVYSWVGHGINVEKGATLIVRDKAICGGIENKGVVRLQKKGKIKVICSEKGSSVSVTGGTITGDLVSYGGKINIKNGKITGSICVDQDAKLTITGGTFQGKKDNSIVYGSGIVKITGGTFSTKKSDKMIVSIYGELSVSKKMKKYFKSKGLKYYVYTNGGMI